MYDSPLTDAELIDATTLPEIEPEPAPDPVEVSLVRENIAVTSGTVLI